MITSILSELLIIFWSHILNPHLLLYAQHESSFTGPILKGSLYEAYLTSLVQEMFLLAQNSEDNQRRQFSSWALSFLQQHLLFKEHLDVDAHRKAAETNLKYASQSFSEDSVVLQLSLWLTDLKNEVSAFLKEKSIRKLFV